MSTLTLELTEELSARLHAASAAAELPAARWAEQVLVAALEQALHQGAAPTGTGGSPTMFELLGDGIGCVDSGLPDLASNPKHLKGFGQWRG